VGGKSRKRWPNASETPVLVTGHSHGGQLAVIAADDFCRRKKRRPTAVYVFGMPRVGDADFAKRYNDTLGNTTYRTCARRRHRRDGAPPELAFATSVV